jgi:hypothetical protein
MTLAGPIRFCLARSKPCSRIVPSDSKLPDRRDLRARARRVNHAVDADRIRFNCTLSEFVGRLCHVRERSSIRARRYRLRPRRFGICNRVGCADRLGVSRALLIIPRQDRRSCTLRHSAASHRAWTDTTIARETSQGVVPAEGFEPPTNGLQNRCSTTELSRHSGPRRMGAGRTPALYANRSRIATTSARSTGTSDPSPGAADGL